MSDEGVATLSLAGGGQTGAEWRASAHGWAISAALHGAALGAALLGLGDIVPPVVQDTFVWEVSLHEAAHAEAGTGQGASGGTRSQSDHHHGHAAMEHARHSHHMVAEAGRQVVPRAIVETVAQPIRERQPAESVPLMEAQPVAVVPKPAVVRPRAPTVTEAQPTERRPVAVHAELVTQEAVMTSVEQAGVLSEQDVIDREVMQAAQVRAHDRPNPVSPAEPAITPMSQPLTPQAAAVMGAEGLRGSHQPAEGHAPVVSDDPSPESRTQTAAGDRGGTAAEDDGPRAVGPAHGETGSVPSVATGAGMQADSNERAREVAAALRPGAAAGSQSNGVAGSAEGSSANTNERATVSAASEGGSGRGGGPDYGWLKRLLWERLEQVKRYSDYAREHEWQGQVVLIATIDRDGRIVGIVVERSSGRAALDRDARQLVQEVSPLPLMRPLGAAKVHLRVPLRFGLEP